MASPEFRRTYARILGELALIAETERLTGAIAQTDVTVIRLSRSMFRRILEEFPDTAIHLRARIAEDLQAMLARINAVVARLGK
jgi:CRP-like cAMP-binding protein